MSIILPPYADFLGIDVETDAEGAPVLAMPYDDHLIGRPGFLHGGAIGGLLEIAAIVAVRHALGVEAARIKPVNVTVSFLRGGRDHVTRAQGIVLRMGARIANVEVVAWQDDRDQPIASARMNCLLVRG